MKAVTYQGYKNMEVCEVNDTTEIITHTIPLEDVKKLMISLTRKR